MRTARLAGLLALVLAGAAFVALQPTHRKPSRTEVATVTGVVDGDTVRLSTGETVRLIGVDTPETKHPGRPVEHHAREATAFTRRVALGKEARLEYDRTYKDRYDRVLAYLYLPDGQMLNALIIQEGAGFAYTEFPFRYSRRFVALEQQAQAERKGLWAHPERARRPVHPTDPSQQRRIADPPGMPATPAAPGAAGTPGSAGADTVWITPHGQRYHRRECRSACSARPVPRAEATAQGFTPCRVCRP